MYALSFDMRSNLFALLAKNIADRNAVTLSIAVGSQNLRTASAKEKRTPAGCPNNKQTHAWHTRN